MVGGHRNCAGWRSTRGFMDLCHRADLMGTTIGVMLVLVGIELWQRRQRRSMSAFRVLQLHSEYAHRGGEEAAVEMDAAILRAHGAEVCPVIRSAVDRTRWRWRARRSGSPVQLGESLHPADQLKAALDYHEPDIVHLHHWQRWGPRALDVLGQSGVPLVATAHNYRHWCVAGTAHRDGTPCNLCMGKRFPWPAIRTAAGTASLGSAVAALSACADGLERRRPLDRGLASFVREALIEAGIATNEQITVRHGSVPDSGPPGDGKEPTNVFALAICSWARREKGLELLLPAWEIRERPGKLIIVGGDLPTHQIGERDFPPGHGRGIGSWP